MIAKVSEQVYDEGLIPAFRDPLLLKAISHVRRQVTQRKWLFFKEKVWITEDQLRFDRIPVSATVNKRERKITLFSRPFPRKCGWNTDLIVYKEKTGEPLVVFPLSNQTIAEGQTFRATLSLS